MTVVMPGHSIYLSLVLGHGCDLLAQLRNRRPLLCAMLCMGWHTMLLSGMEGSCRLPLPLLLQDPRASVNFQDDCNLPSISIWETCVDGLDTVSALAPLHASEALSSMHLDCHPSHAGCVPNQIQLSILDIQHRMTTPGCAEDYLLSTVAPSPRPPLAPASLKQAARSEYLSRCRHLALLRRINPHQAVRGQGL